MRTIAVRLVFLCALVSGCKGSEYKTAPVRGKVTFQGQPVTSGQLFFYPLENQDDGRKDPGKPAFANIDKEGNYQLSTYDAFDGAVIGRHRIMFVGGGGDEEGRPPAYLVPSDKAELEVVAGKNEINIEVVANPDAANWKPRARQRDD
jgi:hypothetical protein